MKIQNHKGKKEYMNALTIHYIVKSSRIRNFTYNRRSKMVEPFKTSITISKDDARRFHEYDSDPLKYENDQSKAAACRARQITQNLKF